MPHKDSGSASPVHSLFHICATTHGATPGPSHRMLPSSPDPFPAPHPQATSEQSPTESLVSRFAKYYTPLVVLACLCLAFIPWAAGVEDHTVSCWVWHSAKRDAS